MESPLLDRQDFEIKDILMMKINLFYNLQVPNFDTCQKRILEEMLKDRGEGKLYYKLMHVVGKKSET